MWNNDFINHGSRCLHSHPCTNFQDLNLYDKLQSLRKVAMETFLRQNEVLCNSNVETEKQGQNLTADELVTVF